MLLLCACSSKADDSGVSDDSPVVVTLFSPSNEEYGLLEDSISLGISRQAFIHGLKQYNIVPTERENGVETLCKYIEQQKKGRTRHLYVIAGVKYGPKLDSIASLIPDDGLSTLLYIGMPSANPRIHTADILTYGMYYSAATVAMDSSLARNYDSFRMSADSANYSYADAWKGFTDVTGLDYSIISGDGNFGLSDMDYPGENIFAYINQFMGYDRIFYLPVHAHFSYWTIYHADNLNCVYVIGTDNDISMYTPKVPFSCVRHASRLLEMCIEQWLSPEGLPQCQRYGLDTEYADLVISPAYSHLQHVADSIYAEAVTKEQEYYRIH